MPKAELSYDTQQILIGVVRQLARPGMCILVFLPGLAEITTLQV